MARYLDVLKSAKSGKPDGSQGVLEGVGSGYRGAGSHLPWAWFDLANLGLICLAVLVAVRPFWQPGIASAADMLMGIYRVFELDRSWHDGILYPRLGSDLEFGYGTPLFEFYPPLASYGAQVFHAAGLGWVEASKAVFTLSLLMAGVGAYVYARWLFGDRRAALVSACAYALAPYLLSDIYERGAAAESLALGLLPWLVYAAHHVLCTRSRIWLLMTALLVALLMLSHNITALFALPFALVYLGLLAWKERSWGRLPALLLALTLGLGMSAFYWIPALAERGYTQIERYMMQGNLRPEENLTPLAELVQPWLAFDYWGPQRFRLALWQVALGALSAAALLWHRTDRRNALGLLAGTVVLILILQLDLTRAFWQGAPLVRFIQFPWRLLGIASFCVALLIGSVLLLKPLAGRAGWLVAAAILAILAFGSVRNLSPQASSLWYRFSSSQVSLTDVFERGRVGFSLFSDYVPIWVTDDSTELAEQGQPISKNLSSSTGAGRLAVIEESPFRLRLQTSAESPFTLRLHRFYYPGWQAYIDGNIVPTQPSGPLGLVTTEVPAGAHSVLVQFQETPLRRASNAFAAVCLLIWGVGMASARRTRLALAILTLALILGAGLALVHLGGVAAPQRPVSSSANFEGQVQLLGYHLPKTDWRAGDTIPVSLYWFALRTPDEDFKVFLHLVRAPDNGIMAQVDSEPILGFSPTTGWQPGELIVDEHELAVPDDTPPGTYRIVTGLYRADTVQNLRVDAAAHTLPGDRVVLAEVRIK